MALRIVPPKSYPTHTAPQTSAPSVPGLHDTLRANLNLTSPAPSSKSNSIGQQASGTAAATTTTSSGAELRLQSTHPLEARLTQWRATQDALRMETLRRTFGIAEPVKRGMELRITAAGEWRPRLLGGGTPVHSDILAGRDCEIGWEDVFKGGEEFRDQPDFHTEMESRLRMNW